MLGQKAKTGSRFPLQPESNKLALNSLTLTGCAAFLLC